PVVLVDAPGFGGTPAGEPGLDHVAAQVVDGIRGLGVDRAVVAGLSMGGYLVMAIAEQAPELLAGIGLLSTKASADPEPARAKRLEMVTAVERGEREVAVPMLEGLLGEATRNSRLAVEMVDELREQLRNAPLAGLVWAQRSMAERPDRLHALQALPDTVPALVLRGAEDTLMSATDAAAMARALGVEVTEVAGSGHLAALEQPDAVAAALADLYARATA
uniref:alpha/beta fold hydrolase n=1 Tax=Pseudactinotalea sp. TaxID=1926260 RepID=UPI003B3BD1F6